MGFGRQLGSPAAPKMEVEKFETIICVGSQLLGFYGFEIDTETKLVDERHGDEFPKSIKIRIFPGEPEINHFLNHFLDGPRIEK